MKVLLDECVDRRLAREIIGHDVATVPQRGWAGIKNGELLSLANEEFDAFITVDRNLSYQQNLSGLTIQVIVIQCLSNRYVDLKPFVPMILEALDQGTAGLLTLLSN